MIMNNRLMQNNMNNLYKSKTPNNYENWLDYQK